MREDVLALVMAERKIFPIFGSKSSMSSFLEQRMRSIDISLRIIERRNRLSIMDHWWVFCPDGWNSVLSGPS